MDARSENIGLLRRFGIQVGLSRAFLLLTPGTREFLDWFVFASAIHFLSVKRSKVCKIKNKNILETRECQSCQKINLKKKCIY